MIVFTDAYLESTREMHEHSSCSDDGWCMTCYTIWRGRYGCCQNTIAQRFNCRHKRTEKIRDAQVVFGYPGWTVARYRCLDCGAFWDDPTEKPLPETSIAYTLQSAVAYPEFKGDLPIRR